MADWDLLDEVDVLSKLPSSFQENLASKKWTERKDSLEALFDLLDRHPRLCTKTNYGEIVNTLQTVLAKDANINVTALSAKCLGRFATGLRAKFAPFVPQFFPIIVERFKEKKPVLKDPLVECIDAFASIIQLETMTEQISEGMEKPNPQIKQQMDNFIARQMNKIKPDNAPRKLIKAIVPILAKHGSDADGDVREAALVCIGSVQRLIGEKNIRNMIGDLEKDEIKMKKVAEHAAKALAAVQAEEAARRAVAPVGAVSADEPDPSDPPADTCSATSSTPRAAQKKEEADPWDFLEPFDVLAKLPANFHELVESKKWQERKEGLEALLSLINDNPRLCSKASYGEIVSLLSKMLEKDANINVSSCAAKCLKGIAAGLRTKFGSFASGVAPIIFEKFKEKKPVLRDPLIECINAVAASTTLESLQEEVLAALGKPNPNIKAQTGLFLRRVLAKHTPANMPKKTLKALVPPLIKNSSESDKEVREAAFAALGCAMCIIGEKAALSLYSDIADDKLKMDKIREKCEEVRAEVGDLHNIPSAAPAKPASALENAQVATKKATTANPAAKKEAKENDEEANTTESKTAKKETKTTKEAATAEESSEDKKKKDELLFINDNKMQRLKDERSLKILKWNFATPDDEHVSQLMQLLGTEATASLVALLFHKDFKMHIKAIDMICQVAETEPEAVVKNSDLLLKWCTLRFFETNPAVLIKVLEMAEIIIRRCREVNEAVSNEEINAFVPYLITKMGEQKENMRMVVRDTMEELAILVSPLRLCPLVIDGLKTKNSRQRAECLIVLEKYVANSGLAQIKNLDVVKAMASCVADRDNNVRNAAINGMVACYRDEGEKIWALAGRMPDKEKSMVDERIKRTNTVPGTARPGSSTAGATPARGGARIISRPNGSVVRPAQGASRDGSRTRDSSPVTSRDEPGLNTTFDMHKNVKRFTLDDEFDEPSVSSGGGRRDQMTLSQMFAELEVAEFPDPSKFASSAVPSIRRSNSNTSISSVDTMEQLDKVINNISSGLHDVALEALVQVQYLLTEAEQRPLLRERIDLLLKAFSAQLRILRTSVFRDDPEKANERVRALLNFLTTLVNDSDAPEVKQASASSLDVIFTEMIACLCDETTQQLRDQNEISRSLNKVIIRFVVNAEPTAVFAALCGALLRSLPQAGRDAELLNKCVLKFAQETSTNRFMTSRVDVAMATANDFFLRMAGKESEGGVSTDALKSVRLAFEKIFLANGAQSVEAARRNPRLHPQLRELAEKLSSRVAMGAGGLLPGQVASSSSFLALHPLVANIAKDYKMLSRTIPAVGDYMSSHRSEAPLLETQISTLMGGSYLAKLVQGYIAYREGKAEDAPCFPSVQYLESADRLNRLLNHVKGGGRGGNPMTSSMTSSVELPSVASGRFPSAVASAPVAAPAPEAARPKRRTMNPAELAPLKERLNQIN